MLFVIANPTAGNGKAVAVTNSICHILDERKIAYRCERTLRPGHAVELSAQAADEGAEAIVCIGGDGTINEVVNGLRGRKMTLYIVSCGTGNDFVKALDLPKDPIEAFTAQLGGKPHSVDVGQVSDRYFVNVAGCGFDVEVLRQANRFKKLGSGLLPYLCGVIAALRKFKPLDIELTIDGKTEKQSVTILSIGNGRYFGGGMKVVPHADPTNGIFDVISIDKVSKPMIARLLPKFISGAHTGLPMAHIYKCTELSIKSPGMTVNLDGELHDMDDCHFRILPGVLTVYLPA